MYALKKNGKLINAGSLEMADAYRKLGYRDVDGGREKTQPRRPENGPAGYAKMPKGELLRLAVEKGIKLKMGATAVDAIKALEANDAKG